MTIKEIAKMAGVSPTTISFYLNGKFEKMSADTVENIKEVIKKTGYKPNRAARDLRLNTTNMIGIIVFDMAQVSAQKIKRSISKGLEKEDYIISLFESELNFNKEKKIIRTLIEAKANTIVIQPSQKLQKGLKKLLKEYPKSKTRIIIIDGHGTNPEISYVFTSHEKALKEISNTKTFKGADQVVYLTGAIEKLQVRTDRYNILSGLAEEVNTKFNLVELEGNDEKAFKSVVSNKKNTVFIANNAEIAFDLYSYLDRNEILGDNNSIVSFNRCYFRPIVKVQLDSIETGTLAMGAEVAKIITQQNWPIIKEVEAKIIKY